MIKSKAKNDNGQSYLETFKSRIHRKYKIGENPNKFNPNMVREGSGVLHKSQDKSSLDTHKTVAYHTKPTPVNLLTDKPWYMLTFEEVIEINSQKIPPKKKTKVPHPGFGSSSKSRIESDVKSPDKANNLQQSKKDIAQKSDTNSSSLGIKLNLETEAALVKNRRLKVSDLEHEIEQVSAQIRQVEADAQTYYADMQRTIAEAEQTDAELQVLKHSAVSIISSARGVILKLVEKNRQNDAAKRKLQQDIKRWEKANRNTMNAYNQTDVTRISDIVQRNSRRLQLRFFVRVGLIRFANRVLSRDKEYREKWRKIYTLGFKSGAVEDPLQSARKKGTKMSTATMNAMSRRQSLTDINRRLSAVNLSKHVAVTPANSSTDLAFQPPSVDCEGDVHHTQSGAVCKPSPQLVRRNSVSFGMTQMGSEVGSQQRNGSVLISSKSMSDVFGADLSVRRSSVVGGKRNSIAR